MLVLELPPYNYIVPRLEIALKRYVSPPRPLIGQPLFPRQLPYQLPTGAATQRKLPCCSSTSISSLRLNQHKEQQRQLTTTHIADYISGRRNRSD